MFGLTATQLALLQSRHQSVKAAVEIDITSPLRYCTGADPITISGDVYTPRALSFGDIEITSPLQSRASVVVDDLDGTIRTLWYAERFSGTTVTYYLMILNNGTWTQVISLSWTVSTCAFNKRGQFQLNLLGGAGTRPRAGLMTGNRSDFMFAPEAGEAMRFGAGGISFSSGHPYAPPPPNGYQGPYQQQPPPNHTVSDGDTVILGTVNDAFQQAESPGEPMSS